MADTCFEKTKFLIALWSEEAVQHELNTLHNKKLVLDKINQEMADGGYSRIVSSVFIFLLLAFEASFAFLLASKSSIAVNIMAAVYESFYDLIWRDLQNSYDAAFQMDPCQFLKRGEL